VHDRPGAVGRAIEVGRLLVEAKESVVRGNWPEWIEENLEFGQRQATRYMRAFKNRDVILNEIGLPKSNLKGLSDAMALLARPRDPGPDGAEGGDQGRAPPGFDPSAAWERSGRS
jgi:hypothetical protein